MHQSKKQILKYLVAPKPRTTQQVAKKIFKDSAYPEVYAYAYLKALTDMGLVEKSTHRVRLTKEERTDGHTKKREVKVCWSLTEMGGSWVRGLVDGENNIEEGPFEGGTPESSFWKLGNAIGRCVAIENKYA